MNPQPDVYDGCIRLILAVVTRATEDAQLQDHTIRREAMAWLRSGEAAWLLRFAGKHIYQRDIDCWLDRLTLSPRRRPGWALQMELIERVRI